MSKSVFGWDLPPGVSMRDIDPPEQPCEVCGQPSDSCICPECPVCGEQGNPKCYESHGLALSEKQIESKTISDQQIAMENQQEEGGY
jgi:hypothetical protein